MKHFSSALLLGVVVIAGCSEASPPVAFAPMVKVITAAEGPTTGARIYSGDVRARHETTLAFRVGGKIVQRLVDVGLAVRPGQQLARLDSADFMLQAAQLEAQRALAAAEARRYRDLRARNFVSQSALDAKETVLQAANTQADLARNQVSYAVLKADRAGVITQTLAEPGQVVAAGQAVFRLAEAGANEVAITIPETHLKDLKPGAPAEVHLSAGSRPLRGKLRELSPMADPVTRTYGARISLLDSDPALALGMTATVRFASDAGNVLTVPHTAIFQQGSQPALWVVGTDDTLALRRVALASYSDAGAVISAGLESGERIVAAGVHKLIAGQKVRPQK